MTDLWSTTTIADIYSTHLKKQASAAGRSRENTKVAALELSGYLERHLWPECSDPSAASFEHVMSIVCMVNFKAHEGVAAWAAFAADPERFGAFFSRVVSMPSEQPRWAATGYDERATWTAFLVTAFATLEDSMVRAQALRLVSLPMWSTLAPKHLQQQLAALPQLARPWKLLTKRRAKEAKMDTPPVSSIQERDLIPELLRAFLTALATAGGEIEEEDDDAMQVEDGSAGGAPTSGLVRYLECTLELIIDLLSQLPTRRFFHAVVLDQHVIESAELSAFALSGSPAAKRFNQLLAMAKFYETYEIDDHTGTALTDAEVKAARCEQLIALQRAAFAMDGLQDFALSNLSAIDSAASLHNHFSRLSSAQLASLTAALGLTHTSDQGAQLGKHFLVRLLVSRYERRVPRHETITQLPLYPNEVALWDMAPSAPSSGQKAVADACLALPKLNLQFLTINDYLMRNFSLFRLEAMSEIKDDIEDVCERLKPRAQLMGKTVFRGWARMALPLASFKLYKVGRPQLGETKPSEVHAEAAISLAGCRPEVSAEWSALKKHDVVFLLTIRAAIAEGGKPDGSLPFPERIGLVSVRGAEVSHVSDDDGNTFTGESENDRRLKGTGRKIDLLLDTAQYHLDAQAMAEGRANAVYEDLNVIVRRRPKENNFKAILQSIRDLMTTPLVVPDWLQEVLLGYGDPASAAYWNLPADQQIERYDFFDTFLDFAHVVEAFPQAEVQLSSGGKAPPPPYRLHIPTAVQRAGGASGEEGAKPVVTVEAYNALQAGPYPEDQPRMNPTRFTPKQVDALRAAMNPGLSVVVGPPGTGKTDTAVQIVSNLIHTFPGQRALIITHSNHALNDVFDKLLLRDVDERYMLRLGHGEELLATEKDFSKLGRVNHMLKRRLELLVRVERLGRTLDITADVGYTCETAEYFFHSEILPRWEAFVSDAEKRKAEGAAPIALLFPFTDFFADAPQPLFGGASFDADMASASGCFHHLERLFTELDECRAFEILRSSYDRGSFLLTKHAKVSSQPTTLRLSSLFPLPLTPSFLRRARVWLSSGDCDDMHTRGHQAARYAFSRLPVRHAGDRGGGTDHGGGDLHPDGAAEGGRGHKPLAAQAHRSYWRPPPAAACGEEHGVRKVLEARPVALCALRPLGSARGAARQAGPLSRVDCRPLPLALHVARRPSRRCVGAAVCSRQRRVRAHLPIRRRCRPQWGRRVVAVAALHPEPRRGRVCRGDLPVHAATGHRGLAHLHRHHLQWPEGPDPGRRCGAMRRICQLWHPGAHHDDRQIPGAAERLYPALARAHEGRRPHSRRTPARRGRLALAPWAVRLRPTRTIRAVHRAAPHLLATALAARQADATPDRAPSDESRRRRRACRRLRLHWRPAGDGHPRGVAHGA